MPSTSSITDQLLQAARRLRHAVDRLSFGPPVTHVYNPLAYAWPLYEAYLRKFAANRKSVVFLGMNPGPFGMVQTGVPFGEVAAVRDWLQLGGALSKPPREHPRRPVTGLDCRRSEVSGRRLWSFFAAQFGPPEVFFAEHLVMNYCPLAFIETTGRNRTPDKLTPPERAALFAVCDAHLLEIVRVLCPDWLIGIGDFAFKRAQELFHHGPPQVGRILHPSPANPAANRDWSGTAARQLRALGIRFGLSLLRPGQIIGAHI